MTKMIIMLLTTTVCFANSITENSYNSLYAIYSVLNINKNNKQFSTEYKLNNNYVYKSENIIFNSEFLLDKPSNLDRKYNYKNSPTLYNRALTLEYKLNNTNAFTIGNMSFADDCYLDYQTIKFNSRNNGIPVLVQTTYDGVFISNKIGNVISKIGYGAYNRIHIFNKEDFMMKENQDSHGLFVLSEYHKNNTKIEFNYYNIDVHYLKDSIGNLQLIGLSYIDRDVSSGIDYYGVFSYSYMDKYIPATTTTKMQNHLGIPTIATIIYPEMFNFNKEKGSGYSYLLGISKEFDPDTIKNFKIGIEYYYASKKYMNLVAPQSGKAYNYDNRGNSVKLFSVIDINKNFAILACTYWFKREYISKIGGLFGEVDSSSTNNLPNNHKIENVTNINLRLKF